LRKTASIWGKLLDTVFTRDSSSFWFWSKSGSGVGSDGVELEESDLSDSGVEFGFCGSFNDDMFLQLFFYGYGTI
jgi:hypothetical protein